jgi:hypothetical protein
MDYELKDSKKRYKVSTGAQRDCRTGKGRFDLLPTRTLKDLAIHFEKGADKYEQRNWEKGIPISIFVDSGLRHAFQFVEGREDENHLIAAIWNLMCAYDTILRIQEGKLPEELYDLPAKITL